MPMIDKTRTTNAKILKQKAKRDGNDYVTPEYLGNKIGVDTREKKEEEAGLREKLKKQVRNEKPGLTLREVSGVDTASDTDTAKLSTRQCVYTVTSDT